MFERLKEDVRTVKEKDPAVKSTLEAILCSPGLHAIWGYRMANRLYRARFYFLARLFSQLCRFITGIEIHPGARIGRRFFIDHGMGIVIGETAVVGDDVIMFHGVTLGGTGREKVKRHPTLGNRVLVGAQATVLGNIQIGDDAKIGAGAIVLEAVPPRTTAVGSPARIIKKERSPD